MKYIKTTFKDFVNEEIKYHGKLTDEEINWLVRRGRASYSGGELRPIIIDGKLVGGISWNLGGIDYIEFLPKYKNKGYLKQVVKDNIENGQVKFVTASDDLQAKLANYGTISNDPDIDITTVTIKENLINERYTDKNINVGDIVDESDVYSYIERMHRNNDDFNDGDLADRIEEFTKYQVALIPIDKIETDLYELDEDDVETYINKYKKLGTYPPITLGYYDKQFKHYNIIDGNHRANALKQHGLKEILCFVGLNKKQKTII